MNESNSIEIIDKQHLTEQTKFRLDEISKIQNYCHEEINQRKSCSKKLSKRKKWWSIYHSVYERSWSSCRNSKCKFYFTFFANNRNNQKVTKHNTKQNEKL